MGLMMNLVMHEGEDKSFLKNIYLLCLTILLKKID